MHKARLIPIQWLRAIAALLVVAHHAIFFANDLRASDTPALLGSIPALPSFGAAGVDLFFVISGFVMAQSIADGRAPSAGGFLTRRAIRILPLFWIATFAFLMVEGWRSFSGQAMMNSITLVPAFDVGEYDAPPLYVGWTLGFEALFYLLVAIVLALRVKRRAEALAAITFALAVAGLFTPHADAWECFLFNPILGEFTLGILGWMAWRRGVPEWLAGGLAILSVPLLLSGIVIDVGQGFSVNMLAVVHGEASLPRLLIWGLPSAMLLVGLVAAAPGTPRRHDMLATIGAASYMLYLIHPIVMRLVALVRTILPVDRPVTCAALIVGASTIAALLLHRALERPLLAMLQGTAGRVGRTFAPSPACTLDAA